jgi:hypothetical protein
VGAEGLMPDSGGAQPNNDMILGEMRGQLREVVHSMANLSQKFDGLAREVIGLGPLAADLAQLGSTVLANSRAIADMQRSSQEIAALKNEVETLKAERNRREGASGIVSIILRSPALGWLVGAAITAWAVLTGKVHV